MIFIEIFYTFQSEYNFLNIRLKIGCVEEHIVPFGHDTWLGFITAIVLKSKAFIQCPIALPWFSPALCGGKGKHCQELLIDYIYIKHKVCCAPIPVHILIMYSIHFCPSFSQLFSYCLIIIQDVMEILLSNLGKATILSLLSKSSYWFHSNRLQVMIPLSMHQHDRIKPRVREHKEVQKTSYVLRLCR